MNTGAGTAASRDRDYVADEVGYYGSSAVAATELSLLSSPWAAHHFLYHQRLAQRAAAIFNATLMPRHTAKPLEWMKLPVFNSSRAQRDAPN